MPKRRPLTNKAGEVRELTREDFDRMRPIAEVDPGMIAAMARSKRVGRPKSIAPKVHIGFRLAADVVERIKATGRGYNAIVEEALRVRFTPKIARVVAMKPAVKRATKAGATKAGVTVKRAAKRKA